MFFAVCVFILLSNVVLLSMQFSDAFHTHIHKKENIICPDNRQRNEMKKRKQQNLKFKMIESNLRKFINEILPENQLSIAKLSRKKAKINRNFYLFRLKYQLLLPQ